MPKKILLFFLILSLNISVYGQKKDKIKGNRNVTSQQTPINSFNKIVVGEDFYVDIIEGQQASVFVETDDNLHDIIQFTVADSVLTFTTTKKITTRKKLSIKVVYTNTLSEIETVDNGEISSLTSINLDNVVVKSSGASRAFLNVKSQTFDFSSKERARVKLNVTANESKFIMSDNSKLDALIESDRMTIDTYQRSDAKVRGNLDKLKVRSSNSSKIEGKDLATVNCELLVEDSSDVTVNVANELFVDLSGSGEVFIYNEPKITLNNFTGTSKLHKKELSKQ